MRILLLVPDGVGVRNFVLGPFLRFAESAGEVHVLHAIPGELLPEYACRHNGRVRWHPLVPYPHRPLDFVLRSALSYAQMYWVNSFLMRRHRNQPVKGSRKTRTAVGAARWIGRAVAGPHGIPLLERAHRAAASRRPEVERYRELLEAVKPSVLFCSHQRPVEILPPVLAARSVGIPTATFIFSWDNITSKGRIAAPFDHFLVWSDQMRGELLRYYPDVSPYRVHIVGTPQFDPYGDAAGLWPRDEFFCRIGADPARPLICFSGGDSGAAPEDPEHLRALMELARDGRIRDRPQVLLRPSPVAAGSRYDSVRRDYPELIYAPPAWTHPVSGNWTAVMPRRDDVPFLANLTHHADLNVNFASTMTLDFAIHDKPIVNMAFDVRTPPRFGMPMWQFVEQLDHYRPVIALEAARLARSVDELANHVNDYLGDPALDREGRRRFVELEVGVPIGHSSQRVLKILQEIAQ